VYVPLPPITDKSIAPVEAPLQTTLVADVESVILQEAVLKILAELNKEMAILLVTHDVGTVSSYVKTIGCINKDLHYHQSNEINNELLQSYNCPIDLLTHGKVPHRVLKEHKHD